MELGIFAKTFVRPELAATLDAVAASGLHAMQFNLALADASTAPEAIRAACAEHGLTMAAVSGTYNMVHPDAGVRAAGQRRLADVIAAAPALGTRVVTLCTGTRDPDDMWRRHPDNATPEAWADLLASLEPALAAAEVHGVTLAIEPEHGNVVDSARAGRRLLDELRSPRLKVIVDPANLDLHADVLREAFALLGDDLVLAHAKDRRADGTVVPAGTGDVDYDVFLSLLRDADVPLILHGLAEHEVPDALAFLRRALYIT